MSGAGDTVIGVLALMVAAGADLHAAMRVANHAAGIVVGKLGTAVVHREELAASLADQPWRRHGTHRHRRRRLHRLQPREGAERRAASATSSPWTTSRAPTRSRNLADLRDRRLRRQARLPRAPARPALRRRGRRAVLHQGACSDTMETDGRYMMENNYGTRWRCCAGARRARVPFIYASSASVYGAGRVFREAREHEAPLNVYGYSKFLFDQVVRRALPRKPRAGRGLPLLQRLRPARGPQGPHGLGGVPLLQPVPRRPGRVKPLRGQRRLRPRRADPRLHLASTTWCA